MTVAREVAAAEVVGEDDDDIRPRLGRDGCWEREHQDGRRRDSDDDPIVTHQAFHGCADSIQPDGVFEQP